MPFEYKSKLDRVKEVVDLYHKLNKCGFPNDLEGIVELKEILSGWVKDGEYDKGRIYLRGWERIIHYELYNRKGSEIAVNLIYEKNL